VCYPIWRWRVSRKLSVSGHMLYNNFDLFFNKELHYGELVRKFRFTLHILIFRFYVAAWKVRNSELNVTNYLRIIFIYHSSPSFHLISTPYILCSWNQSINQKVCMISPFLLLFYFIFSPFHKVNCPKPRNKNVSSPQSSLKSFSSLQLQLTSIRNKQVISYSRSSLEFFTPH
jgi:hypothetical protein